MRSPEICCNPLRIRNAERGAAKQAASNEIRLLFDRGRELVRANKLELKGSLGARSLDLVKFKVNPLREGQGGGTKKAASEVAPKGVAFRSRPG